jgi:hypothetical protein
MSGVRGGEVIIPSICFSHARSGKLAVDLADEKVEFTVCTG